jgi:hypothetical protein
MDETRSVSVLIRSGDLGDRLPQLVGMLDDQNVPSSRYEVIFLDPGSSDGTSERLRHLVDRRPNVGVVATDGDSWHPALDAAGGEFVLCVGEDDVLLPYALEVLLTVAEGKDVVLAAGGDGGPVGFIPDSVDATGPVTHDDPAAAIRVLAPFALIRRQLLVSLQPDQLTSDQFRRTRVGLLTSSASIGTCSDPVGLGAGPASGTSGEAILADASAAAELLGDVDCAAWLVAAHAAALDRATGGSFGAELQAQLAELVLRRWKDKDPTTLPPLLEAAVRAVMDDQPPSVWTALRTEADLAPTIESAVAAWSAGALTLEAAGTIPAALSGRALVSDTRTVRFAVRNVSTGTRYDLASDVTTETSQDSTRFVARAALNITDAAAGRRLTEGVWQVLVRLVGTGAVRPITIAAPVSTVPGAVVDGIPVSIFTDGGRPGQLGQLRLDVGARQQGLLGVPFSVDQAKITESARGALLSIIDPQLTILGEEAIPAVLYLGAFKLPATLRRTESGARLECYLSGLAGVSKLEVQVGRSQRQPLGLQVRIAATGEMTVEPATPDRPAAKKPVKTAGKKSAAKHVANTPATNPANKTAKKSATTKSPSAKRRSAKQRRSRRVVDRVPGPLRPVAEAASRSPLLQKAYQRLRRLA